MSDDKRVDNEVAPFLPKQQLVESTIQIQPADGDSSATTCGFWIFKGPLLQRFATENIYMAVYGIAGCLLAASFAYFNGTITTMEKRYKIPSRTTGIILIGNDISTMVAGALLGYYAGRGHRPRWIGFGLLTIALFCLLTLSLHFLFGAGDEALQLTREYQMLSNATAALLPAAQLDKTLCSTLEPSCVEDVAPWVPQLILFVAQLISGIGQALLLILGIAYLDDNSSKSKSPAMISWSSFLRMLGPAMGYSLCSACLRLYIAPSLEPMIDNTDPRWLGAWWLGWIVLAAALTISAGSIFMFPQELPSGRKRRLENARGEMPAELSLDDLFKTVKRLLGNKVFVYNTMASTFYFFGYIPYWLYTSKYIETQYRQSAATANMATGTVAIGFSATGVLLSGYIISKYKPSARSMAAWNGVVDLLTVLGILSYMLIGCADSDQLMSLSVGSQNCSASCHCDYVNYAPICGQDNITYTSACHAGCTGRSENELGQTIYTGCSCVAAPPPLNDEPEARYATAGTCPIDCSKEFYVFLAVMCCLKLVGASGRSTNLLIALRCVAPEDKSFALGFGSMIASLFCFIPSPILFGWLLDSLCIVWGKTCTNKGNCWLYDTKSFRYTFSLSAASFIFIGAFWNIGVWYHVKHLKVFDEETKEAAEFELVEKESK